MNSEYINRLGTELSGMDGGNINAKLWFCGLEWGGTPNLEGNEEKLPTYKSQGISNAIPCVDSNWVERVRSTDKKVTKPQFDQKIAKIILSWMGKQWQNPKDKATYYHYHTYMENRLHFQDGDIFKLNLYPEAKSSFWDWIEANMSQRTGCITPFEFYAKCMEYRFPMIKNLVDKCSPDVVVCIGKEHMNEYIAAFWGREVLRDVNGGYSEIVPTERFLLSNDFTVSVYSTNKPILIGLPFLGSQLLSDVDMIAIGSLLHSYTKPTA